MNVWKIWYKRESECFYRRGPGDQSESRMRRMEEKQRGCYILAGIGWTKEQKVSNGDQVSCE